MDARNDHRRTKLLAALQGNAHRAPGAEDDLCDASLRSDLRAERLGRASDRVRDGAHPALLEPPAAQMPVADVPDRVMEHDVGRPGLVRPGPRSDDAVDREHGL